MFLIYHNTAMRTIIFAFLSLLFLFPLQEKKPTLILNATAVVGDGEVINNAAVAFNDKGAFTLVGDATRIKLDLKEFETTFAHGKYIYPLSMLGAGLEQMEEWPVNTENLTDSLLIKADEEASFAILSAPLGQKGDTIVSLFLRGREVEPLEE